MIFRFILFMILATSLFAQETEDTSWYDKIEPKIEAGMFIGNFSGSHSTSANDYTYFKDDLGYSNTLASYFALDVRLNYDYVPNFGVSYSNVRETRNANLDDTITIVGFPFSGPITSKIEYEVINYLVYYEVKQKGKWIPFLWWHIYPGDIEYSVGINIEAIDWNFQIIDRDSSDTFKFVNIVSAFPMPFLGMKYYYYKLTVYANASAIAFNEVKSTNYEAGVDYQVVKDVYLSASYMYDDFQTMEQSDTIRFKTAGSKFSFKYKF